MAKSNKQQQQNNQLTNTEEVQPANNERVTEMTEAQKDGIRYDYNDSSDFK